MIGLDLIGWAVFCKLQNDAHLDRILEERPGAASAICPKSYQIKGHESFLLQVKLGMAQQLRIKAALGFAWQPAKGSRVILRRDDLAFKSNRNDLSRDLNDRRG